MYLAAIEDEEWQVIGAPVYVRGFMRTYARFLGLDPEAAVARFSAAVPPGTPAASTPRPPAATTATEKRAGEGGSPSLAAVLAIVVAVVAVLFVGYEFYQYRAGAPEATPVALATAGPADDVAAPAPDATSADDEAPAEAPTIAPVVHVAVKRGLTVKVIEPSWMRVTVDGTVEYEGTLPAGSTKSFRGKAADIIVGNAGGVRIAINGHAVRPLGASGDVVERRFALTGE